jgi:hypothetical protein
LPSALAVCLGLLAVAPAAAEPQAEPGLAEVQEAAARLAGGPAEQDASRTARARAAHWAPALRGQAGLRDGVRTRRGEARLAPLREDDTSLDHTWAVLLNWDFSQVIFAREETQLALAHANLARVRRDAAGKAAQLWIDRRRARTSYLGTPPGAARASACFSLLLLTAELEALTGLFRDAVSHQEAACALEEKR